MAWNDLTIAQRSQLMNMFRHSGITDLTQMRQTYDSMSDDSSLSSLVGPIDIRTSPAPMYSEGGTIHIKPENRGKFTALKERTGHSATWFKEHGTPAQKKMAVFALNAKHWKHSVGGNLFYQGGSEEVNTPEYRIYNNEAITEQDYINMQRQAATDLAVKKALERERGVAPIINGYPDSSCLYTATDNFGNKYRVASNPLFFKNPEKFGFEVARPMSDNPQENVGRLYQQIDIAGRPFHMNFITGVGEDGKNKVTYSRGHAGNKPMTRAEWEEQERKEIEFMTKMAANFGKTYDQSTRPGYDEYYKLVSEEYNTDYVKNKNIWDSAGYETYRFIGTPEDNARWSSEFRTLPQTMQRVEGVLKPGENMTMSNRVNAPTQNITRKHGGLVF